MWGERQFILQTLCNKKYVLGQAMLGTEDTVKGKTKALRRLTRNDIFPKDSSK